MNWNSHLFELFMAALFGAGQKKPGEWLEFRINKQQIDFIQKSNLISLMCKSSSVKKKSSKFTLWIVEKFRCLHKYGNWFVIMSKVKSLLYMWFLGKVFGIYAQAKYRHPDTGMNFILWMNFILCAWNRHRLHRFNSIFSAFPSWISCKKRIAFAISIETENSCWVKQLDIWSQISSVNDERFCGRYSNCTILLCTDIMIYSHPPWWIHVTCWDIKFIRIYWT